MLIIIIDNYDSFVYNLYQYLSEFDQDVHVYRNDRITQKKIAELSPNAIVLSPGPGHPAVKRDFGVCTDVLANATKKTKILGVCLGHQGIIYHFGGEVTKNKPMHGKTSLVKHNELGLFSGVANPFRVMRYHSLAGTKIPDCLEVTAKCIEDDVVMAVKHKDLPICGVQFHPESIMTENGMKILENFLKL
ncbi:MAG: aminodeoxychorismate/anthranilate synthase component II [Candidatus Micrarchaeota archaeon]